MNQFSVGTELIEISRIAAQIEESNSFTKRVFTSQGECASNSFYVDCRIFAFHYFRLFMLSGVMLDWVESCMIFLFGEDSSIVSSIRFNLFLLIIPMIYGFLASAGSWIFVHIGLFQIVLAQYWRCC